MNSYCNEKLDFHETPKKSILTVV